MNGSLIKLLISNCIDAIGGSEFGHSTFVIPSAFSNLAVSKPGRRKLWEFYFSKSTNAWTLPIIFGLTLMLIYYWQLAKGARKLVLRF